MSPCLSHAPEVTVRNIYFDEAGIGNPEVEPYTVVAGVMLHVDDQLGPIQKYLLDMADDLIAPGLERPLNFAFHAKDLWHGAGFFPRQTDDNLDGWSLERRLEILGHLADIPQKFEMPIIYACVKREDYAPENPPEGSAPRFFKQARAKADRKCHMICFMSCLQQTERWMEHAYKNEKVQAIVEWHDDHKEILLDAAQLFANPRIHPVIENDPNISWDPLTHFADDPLFVKKSGSSPVQIADICAFILCRALAEAQHSKELLEKIKPCLITGFRREFVGQKKAGAPAKSPALKPASQRSFTGHR